MLGYLTVTEACARFGYRREMMWKDVKAGKIAGAVLDDSGDWQIPVSGLREWKKTKHCRRIER
jgi:hypothetical protein